MGTGGNEALKRPKSYANNTKCPRNVNLPNDPLIIRRFKGNMLYKLSYQIQRNQQLYSYSFSVSVEPKYNFVILILAFSLKTVPLS